MIKKLSIIMLLLMPLAGFADIVNPSGLTGSYYRWFSGLGSGSGTGSLFFPSAQVVDTSTGTPSIPWTPSNMTTVAWYDASDTNTITESAGSVSQWDDKSGNNNHAVQGTGSSQPATGVTNINSLNALKFNSDYMSLSTGLTTVRAVFFVTDGVQGSVGDSVWAPMFGEDSHPGSYTMLRCDSDAAYDISIDGAVSDTGNAGISGNTPVAGDNITLVPASSIAERLNNPYQFYVDWTASTTVDWLGALKPSGASWTARTVFGEFILLTSVPSTADRQKLEGYLAWKWGLEDELPAGHPYKDAAPTQ